MNKYIIADTMSITDLPIDQLKAYYRNDETPCCVGARLAGYFQIEGGYYLSGLDEFAKRLGGNRAHVILMLREAGAGRNPFSADEWSNTPKDVWRNLLKTEELPSLSGADLSETNLSSADLSRSDLTGANLSRSDLTCVNLSDAYLSDSDLSHSHLNSADLRGTDLRDADLSGSDLYNANLSNADLTGANLLGTDLTGANLFGTDLTRTNHLYE